MPDLGLFGADDSTPELGSVGAEAPELASVGAP
jgi:hypothetical protein